MSALKNLLKSDTPAPDSVPPGGNSGKISGQGTHFPSKDDSNIESTVGSTYIPGTDVSRGNDTSVQSDAAQTVPSSAVGAGADVLQAGQHSGGSVGQAAIGETTTYSKSQLTTGDPTSSVVDRESENPMTYLKPEASPETGNAGVTSGAAAAAASTAFEKSGERMPGEFPAAGYENPYKTTQLDPRVDGGKADNTGGITSTGVGAGAAAAGASQAFSSSQEATVPAPSTLTTTTDPVDRSAEYQASAQSKGLGGEAEGENQGVIGKVLGAIGLGGAAGAAAAAVGYGSKKEDEQSAVDSGAPVATKEQGPPKHYRRESIPTTAYPHGRLDTVKAVHPPVGAASTSATDVEEGATDVTSTEATPAAAATAGVGAGVAGGAVAAHEHDKSADLGGQATSESYQTAHDATTQRTAEPTAPQESNLGRDAAVGGAAVAAAGAGGYAIHEHKKTEDTTTATSVTDTKSAPEPPIDAVAAAPGRYEGQDVSPPRTTTTAATAEADKPKDEEDHTARNTALGVGAGAAAIGGAAYAKHEHDEKALAEQQAAKQKELEQQKAAQEKQAAKEEKAHQKEVEKEEKKAEKEQKKAEKEAEKEQKKAEKEAEKEQKKAEKEHKKEEKAAAAAAEAEEEKQRRESQRAAWEEEKRRKQAEEEDENKKEGVAAAAGVGAAGTAVAGAAAYEQSKDEKPDDATSSQKEKEKKPSIFKRIFKRRKNKDTGEDEEYSTDEEDTSGSGIPHHHSNSKGRNVLGSGTAQSSDGKPIDPVTGLAYDPAKDEAAARRLSQDPEAPAGPRGVDAAPAGGTGLTGSAIDEEPPEKPIDKYTGLPYDPQKDPEAAQRLSQAPDTAVGILEQTGAIPTTKPT